MLEAGAVGRGGEVLTLDMGEPIRILDLAEQMIRLAGLRPYQDIPIVFIGLRPGEKLHEDLDRESRRSPAFPTRRFSGADLPPHPGGEIRDALARLAALALDGDSDAIRSYLGECLPDARLSGATALPSCGAGL